MVNIIIAINAHLFKILIFTPSKADSSDFILTGALANTFNLSDFLKIPDNLI
jgi:hypothetical protein